MPVRPQAGQALATDAENQRRALERQAMAELPYDPVKDDPDYKSPITGKPISVPQK
jgi:hypothetical protein